MLSFCECQNFKELWTIDLSTQDSPLFNNVFVTFEMKATRRFLPLSKLQRHSSQMKSIVKTFLGFWKSDVKDSK